MHVCTFFLSGSRTAFLAALVPLLYTYSRETFKFRKSLVNYLIFSLFGLMIVGYLYSRGAASAWERLEMLRNVLGQGELMWGHGFGSGTLSIHTYSHLYPSLQIALEDTDTLYTSLLIQGGLWLFGTTGIVAIYTFWKLGTPFKICMSVFLFIGLGMVALEVWPFNIVVFAMIGWLLRENTEK